MLQAGPASQPLENRPIELPHELDRCLAAGSLGQKYKFDVYVSCSEADQNDVEQELIEPLKSAQLKIIWEKEFQGGVDLVAARSDAITNSRHTIVVLTETWCSSPAAIDDALTVRFTDLGAADRKILPVRWKPCKVPEKLRLDRLKPYDFVDVTLRQVSLLKLIEELGTSQQAVNEIKSEFAQQGFRALVDLMATPEIHVAVQSVENAFTTALDEIDELYRCKRMHEYFHAANEQYKLFAKNKESLLEMLRKPFDECEEDHQSRLDDQWAELETIINIKLSPHVVSLVNFAKTGGFNFAQTEWAPEIETALAELISAAECKKAKDVKKWSAWLSRIFSTWPSRFDQQLLDAATRLRLTTVVGGLKQIQNVASQFEFQKNVADRLTVFALGISALSDIGQAVQNSVQCHNLLQSIDDILQTLQHPCMYEEDVEKILDAWFALQPKIGRLLPIMNAEWRPQFESAANGLTQAVEDTAAIEIDLRKFNRALGKFYGAVSTTFTQADLELWNLCDKLKKIRQELAAAIRNLTHE